MSKLFQISRVMSRSLAIVAVVATLIAPMFAQAASEPRDSDANAIMYGGAYSKTEWANNVAKGDGKNSAANLQKIYYDEDRGITKTNVMASTTVDGTVFKDGHVEVGGKTVATGAKSVGRTNMTGSTKSGSVWERPTSVSFNSNSIPAFVSMEGGTFHYAIIKSCGNPVRATAVKKPTPSTTATPKPSPSASPTPMPTPPLAVEQKFICLRLTPSQPDKTNKPGTFRFNVDSEIENVSLTGYRVTITKDGSTQGDVRDTDASTDYADFELGPGIWKVQAQVKTTAGISEVCNACSAMVTVNPAPTPSPTGQVLGVTLPATGPETALGGVAGITALGYMGRAYVRSRKSVVDALRKIK